MKNWWAIPFGVVCGLLGAGILRLMSSQPQGEAIQLSPPPTPPPLTIHIGGAVYSPGVYSLPRESRVQDALQAAGGVLPEASTSFLNLAAYVQDGERIWVPFQNAATPELITPGNSNELNPNSSQPESQNPAKRIDINTASQSELESLPRIGPVMAENIIAYRTANGPFLHIEDIQDVSGIGPATFQTIKELISVGDQP